MKINEETTISEEQVLFNKLSYEEQQFILKQMRMLQPCELSCEIEENKIPEKLFFTHISNYNDQSVVNNNFNNYFKKTQETINEIINYLKSKGDE